MVQEIADSSLGSNNALRRYNDLRELIGSLDNPTPLMRTMKKDVGLKQFELFLKLEWFSPFGSVKDRTAKYILKGLEERGELASKNLVEPTSGNMGIALAGLMAIMGKQLTVVISNRVSEEKKMMLRMLGAKVRIAEGKAVDLACSIAENGEEFIMPNQYNNLDNVQAHYETMGPEIWKQTEGRIRFFFAGFGTGGTITGVGKYLKEQNPDIQVIAVEPEKGRKIAGLRNLEEIITPSILDRNLIDHVIQVSDKSVYAMIKRLFREEGLVVGPSTGAIVCGAVKFGQDKEGVAVAVAPDSGFRYASYFTKII